MSQPYLGEIRLMGFAHPPKGWALCDGQLLPIEQNQLLYSLLSTTFGGDGKTTFALPNFSERVPIHVGLGHVLGESGGEQTHRLSVAEMPSHAHRLQASSGPANSFIAGSTYLAGANEALGNVYAEPSDLVPMRAKALYDAGGGEEHDNLQPCLVVSFCIAIQGTFPSQF